MLLLLPPLPPGGLLCRSLLILSSFSCGEHGMRKNHTRGVTSASTTACAVAYLILRHLRIALLHVPHQHCCFHVHIVYPADACQLLAAPSFVPDSPLCPEAPLVHPSCGHCTQHSNSRVDTRPTDAWDCFSLTKQCCTRLRCK
jgi:hypothetical protein